jgi:hypothetical protein
MSANTETTGGPPKGYVECEGKCGRWAYLPCNARTIWCNACVAGPSSYERDHPDWTPPIAATAPKIEVKATVDGKCPLCGVAIPSTHIHLCSHAAPEPAKQSACVAHGLRECAPCVESGVWALAPAQEAPKAAPVCTNGRDCKTPSAPVLERVLRDEMQPMCDRCYLEVERNLERLMMFESTGKPYAGPERLPRPQLAADWVEDCLGDVRR